MITKGKEFQITTLQREDLEYEGFISENVSDETMEEIARRIRYCIMDTYWEVLHSYCNSHGIKSKLDLCEKVDAILIKKYPGKYIIKSRITADINETPEEYQDEFNALYDQLENEYLNNEK